MKKILIDANPIVPFLVSGRLNGIGRTCIELIKSLDKLRDGLSFEIELFTQNIKGVSAKTLGSGFQTRHIYLRNKPLHNEWSRKLHLRELLTGYDFQHITHNYEIVTDPSKCIVTIHDAMFFSYPENFLGAENNRKTIPGFAKKAKHIITISENSKKDIIHYMDIPEEKISVIPWGVDQTFHYPHIPETNRWTGGNPYFASVSCDIGRKNTVTLLEAYKKFSYNHPLHHLILVWRNPPEDILALTSTPLLKDKVHFVSNLTNKELGDIYAGATATFFPSLYEGFGLPILESMACGVPCVTSENSSLPEVGGKAAIYVDPLDSESIALEMEKFENGNYNLQELKEKSIRQAEKFTWKKCAESTLKVYKECLEL